MTPETKADFTALQRSLEQAKDRLHQAASHARSVGMWLLASALEEQRRSVATVCEVVSAMVTIAGGE